MEIPPPISYAEREGVRIAFQEFGEGPDDLIMISDPPSHLDLLWTDSGYVDVLLALGEGMRTIFYDRRGTGLSDPLDQPPTLEGQALDLEAVMDAAGSERADLFGWAGSSMTAAYFAATRPGRVERLVLFSPWAHSWSEEQSRWPTDQRAAAKARMDRAIENWGDGSMLTVAAPALDTPRNRRLFGMLERASASRAVARITFDAALQLDLSSVFPSIQAPTLVVHHEDAPVPAEVVAEVAELIPGAELVRVGYDGEPHAMADYWWPTVNELRRWLTGTNEAPRSPTMVTTLMFTDIVGSTGHAARLGDAEWRKVLKNHDDSLRDLIEEEGGRLVKTIGDGSMSVYDGPVQAVRCARRLNEATKPLGIELRAGIHTGECERVGLDFAGMNVHVAARVEGQAEPGEVLVTSASMELCGGSGLEFAPRAPVELKGVPGVWTLHSTRGATAGAPVPDDGRPLRPGDRAVLATARRAPRLLRAVGRVFR
jgi:class 3 adenylate cyclase